MTTGLTDQDRRRIEDALDQSVSDNTRVMYASAWRSFKEWARARGCHPCRLHRSWWPLTSWNWPKNASSRWSPSGCTRLRPPGDIFLELHPRKLPPQVNLVLLPIRRIVQYGADIGADILRADVLVPVMVTELPQSPLSDVAPPLGC